MTREEVSEVVSTVAPYLYGFKAKEQCLVHDFGYKLLFYDGWNKSEIVGKDCRRNHRIGCSFKKHPKKIAADIKRRLLPGYREDFLKFKHEKQKDEEKRAQEAQMLKALAYELGGEIINNYLGEHVSAKNVKITQAYDGQYKIEALFDFSDALKVSQFMSKNLLARLSKE